ncbi:MULTISPECIES: acyltransferase [unclassified Mesorhizobium]|uniref:acyltransferase family protein n=1 Tax=unclassified Mesorhizobium TaxID=325217 RepID=UPI000FD74EC8|nr:MULTISPECIES: acyltransferase [unclassified Mesorhizobium]TGS18149.1 acyltransferase [Mesorhizobium sp. M2E.F.Ca.ET.209.01.1.1]
MVRLYNLDGLRGFSAMLVVFGHLFNQLGVLGGIFGDGGAQVGVQIFFALSGFLMGFLYLRFHIRKLAAIDFLRRRTARVFPMYVAVVLASYLSLSYAGHPIFYAVNSSNLVEHLLFVKGVSVLWTVPVEVHFYLIFIFIWLVFSVNRAIGIISLAAMIPVLLFIPDPLAIRPSQLSFFLIGIMASLVPPFRSNTAFALAVCAIFVAMPAVSKTLGITVFEFWRSPLNVAATGTLLYTSINAPLAKLTFGSLPARYIGQISFSVYLLHWPIMAAITTHTDVDDNGPLYVFTVVVLTLLISSLTYFSIEAPARRWITGRNGWVRNDLASATAVADL